MKLAHSAVEALDSATREIVDNYLLAEASVSRRREARPAAFYDFIS